jgi:hypothetical protein
MEIKGIGREIDTVNVTIRGESLGLFDTEIRPLPYRRQVVLPTPITWDWIAGFIAGDGALISSLRDPKSSKAFSDLNDDRKLRARKLQHKLTREEYAKPDRLARFMAKLKSRLLEEEKETNPRKQYSITVSNSIRIGQRLIGPLKIISRFVDGVPQGKERVGASFLIDPDDETKYTGVSEFYWSVASKDKLLLVLRNTINKLADKYIQGLLMTQFLVRWSKKQRLMQKYPSKLVELKGIPEALKLSTLEYNMEMRKRIKRAWFIYCYKYCWEMAAHKRKEQFYYSGINVSERDSLPFSIAEKKFFDDGNVPITLDAEIVTDNLEDISEDEKERWLDMDKKISQASMDRFNKIRTKAVKEKAENKKNRFQRYRRVLEKLENKMKILRDSETDSDLKDLPLPLYILAKYEQEQEDIPDTNYWDFLEEQTQGDHINEEEKGTEEQEEKNEPEIKENDEQEKEDEAKYEFKYETKETKHESAVTDYDLRNFKQNIVPRMEIQRRDEVEDKINSDPRRTELLAELKRKEDSFKDQQIKETSDKLKNLDLAVYIYYRYQRYLDVKGGEASYLGFLEDHSKQNERYRAQRKKPTAKNRSNRIRLIDD